MKKNLTVFKYLRRLEFVLIHTGLMLILSGLAVMLYVDADSWTGWFSIVKALFSGYESSSYTILLDRGVLTGWILLICSLSLHIFIPRHERKTDSYDLLDFVYIIAWWAVTAIVALLIIIFILTIKKFGSLVQIVHILMIINALWGYVIYLKRCDQKTRAAADFTVSISMFMIIFVIINFYFHKHNTILDASSAQYYTLGDKTRTLVTNLKKKVKVYAIIMSNQHRKGMIYDYTTKLFTQINNLTDSIDIEFVKPRSTKAIEILRRYNITQQNEAIIYECGANTKAIPIDTTGAPLAVLKEEQMQHPLMNRSVPEIKAYKGENSFYLAINEVTSEKRKEIIFIDGHGERSITEYTNESLTSLDKELTNLNYITHTKRLQQGELPNADALVIAAPQHAYLDWEIELIQRYLKEKNGGLIYLAEPIYADFSVSEAGLAPILEEYGIIINNDRITSYHNKSKTYTPRISTDLYAMHPITKAFTNEQVYMTTARSLNSSTCRVLSMKPEELISITSAIDKKIWGETRFGRKLKSNHFDQNDTAPPLRLVVTSGPRVSSGSAFQTPRIAVIGDVDIAANYLIYKGNNKDFLLNCINWSLNQEKVELIAPKNFEFIRVNVDNELMSSIFDMIVISIPGFILLFGALVLVRRRS